MSILGSISNSGSMNGPILNEFKKQASFFLKEKIKTARLAFTDVTPAEILTEEATNGSTRGPDARTLKMISKAAFEVDDHWRIVEILHRRLVRFDSRDWRASYKVLIVLEQLLTHGPGRVAEEFQCDRDVIGEIESFQHIDEKGFNWGLNARKKSERILKLLEKGPFLKEERDKNRRTSRGIQGFGSFSFRSSSGQEIHQGSSPKALGRCNSEFNDHTDQQGFFFSVSNEKVKNIKTETEKPLLPANPKTENLSPESFRSRADSEENLAPNERVPLLGEQKCVSRVNMSMGDHHSHPFEDDPDDLTATSLLSTSAEEL